MRIITFGTYDLFHIGHLNIINRCKKYKIDQNNKENTLYVGVSTDELNFQKKNHYPIISEDERVEIISNIKAVDFVFKEESLEKKREYCIKYNIDMLIMGDDHVGRFDFLRKDNIKVVYLERTTNVSTTLLIDKIKKLS